MSTRLVVTIAGIAGIVALAACESATTAPANPVYSALLNNASEVPAIAVTAPPTVSSGKASFTLVVTAAGRTLQYAVYDSGLTANASAAHIHVGAAGAAGPPVVPFKAIATKNGTVSAGTINLDVNPVMIIQGGGKDTTIGSISGDSLLVLLRNGNAYVNIHNAGNPGGEVRGQVTVR